MDRIMPNRLDRGFYKYQSEYEEKAIEVLRSGWYVLGHEVSSFEQEFASYTGAKYCAGLASGLDALWIAFRVLGIGSGDEVIVQGNTYIASVMGITINGATPVFVEPDEYFVVERMKIVRRLMVPSGTESRLEHSEISVVFRFILPRIWEPLVMQELSLQTAKRLLMRLRSSEITVQRKGITTRLSVPIHASMRSRPVFSG